jgi:hypothetical protein
VGCCVVWSRRNLINVSQVLAASIVRAIALIMEAASTSETSVNFSQTTRCNNPEDSHLRTRHRENLKSHKTEFHWILSSVETLNKHSELKFIFSVHCIVYNWYILTFTIINKSICDVLNLILFVC